MRLSTLLEDEKRTQALERQALLSQVTALIESTAEKQTLRVEQGITSVQTELGEHGAAHGQVHENFVTEGHQWSERSEAIVSKAMKSRETVKTKIKSDFAVSFIYYEHFSAPLIIVSLQTSIPNRYETSRPLCTTPPRAL